MHMFVDVAKGKWGAGLNMNIVKTFLICTGLYKFAISFVFKEIKFNC